MRRPAVTLAAVTALLALLAACSEDGGVRLPISAESGRPASEAASGTGDREAPDVFQVAEDGLWDGRPSLGGVWVAHPDVADPERVIIRNETNGQFVVGALFRRERENPGPELQVSSDAAEALGMLAGDPTPLNVTALRREEGATPAASAATADVAADDGTAPEADAATPAVSAAGEPTEPAADADPEALSAATAAVLAGAPAAATAAPDHLPDAAVAPVPEAAPDVAAPLPAADMTIPPEADPAILEAARTILAEADLPDAGFATAGVEAAPVTAIAATSLDDGAPIPVGSAAIAGVEIDAPATDLTPVPAPAATSVEAAGAAPVEADPDLAAATASILATTAPASPATAAGGDPTPTERPFLQIGLFGVEANAQEIVARLAGQGIPARVVPVEGDTPMWRVLAGPSATVGERDALLARVQGAGFPDAYPVTN